MTTSGSEIKKVNLYFKPKANSKYNHFIYSLI